MRLPLLVLVGSCLLPGLRAAELVIDRAHSQFDIEVKATVDSFTGHLADYQAAIDVNDTAHRIDQARFDFAFTAVKTGKDARDKKMGDWAETGRYPQGHYEMTSLDAGPDGHYTAHGKLTLHGVTKPLDFPLAVATMGAVWSLDGEATIDTRDYDLPVIRMALVMKVDPVVKVRFHVQGAAPAAGGKS